MNLTHNHSRKGAFRDLATIPTMYYIKFIIFNILLYIYSQYIYPIYIITIL